MLTRDIDIGILSVRPSVRPSVTLRYCIETVISVSLWRDPDDVLHCRILSPHKMAAYIYIYYEIVHKVHNKTKMKKRQEKIKTKNKNTFKTTHTSEYS